MSNDQNIVWSEIGKFGFSRPAPSVTFGFIGSFSGKLYGSTTEMEYSLDGGINYKDVTESDMVFTAEEITKISAKHDIYVRYKCNALLVIKNV